eukprot:9973129-Alexandrium_andersonii.AAC.1
MTMAVTVVTLIVVCARAIQTRVRRSGWAENIRCLSPPVSDWVSPPVPLSVCLSAGGHLWMHASIRA